MSPNDRYAKIREALDLGPTPGPWGIWVEPVRDRHEAIAELTEQVQSTDPFVGKLFLLNAGGKCPATTGCGSNSEANAAYIAACDPDTIRALLESNAALERERNQLLDKLHCMCGSPIDHSAWEGHTPVSVYDYSLDQERARAEAAEARLAEALKALAEVRRRARNIWGACSSDQIIDKDVERQAKLMLEYIDTVRSLVKGGGDE